MLNRGLHEAEFPREFLPSPPPFPWAELGGNLSTAVLCPSTNKLEPLSISKMDSGKLKLVVKK